MAVVWRKQVHMVLYVNRNDKVYQGRGWRKDVVNQYKEFGVSPMPLLDSLLTVRLCCLMSRVSVDNIRDKLRPMPKHGSILLYVHGNQKDR